MGFFTKAAPDKPRFKKIKEEGCLVTFSVEVPIQEVEAQAQTGLMRIQQRAHLPGFRQGKAPMELIQKRFADHAMDEAVEDVIRRCVPEALRELKIEPVAPPRISSVERKPGEPLRLLVAAEVAPLVEPRSYTRIPVRKADYPATDEAVAKRIEDLRESHARLEPEESGAVAKTHYVVVDYAGAQGGRPVPGLKGTGVLVDMSSDENLEGLAKGLEGQARGETREIPVKVRKKDAVLTVTVREIKRKILPPLDADFAKDLGFETVEELRKALREVIEKEGLERSDHEVVGQIEEALLKANQIPLPPSLVEAHLESMFERLRKQYLGPDRQWPDAEAEKIRARLRPQAEKELGLSYILASIAEREKLAALDSEVKEEMDKSLDAARSDEHRAELRRLFEERKDTIAGIIRDRKTMAFLKEKSVVSRG